MFKWLEDIIDSIKSLWESPSPDSTVLPRAPKNLFQDTPLNETLRVKITQWLTAAESVLENFFPSSNELHKFNQNPLEQQTWETDDAYQTRLEINNTLCHLEEHACGKRRYPKPSHFEGNSDVFKALHRSQKAHLLLSVGAEITETNKKPIHSQIKRHVCTIEFTTALEDVSGCLLRDEFDNPLMEKTQKKLTFFATSPDGKCGDYCINSWNREETIKLILTNKHKINDFLLAELTIQLITDFGYQRIRDFFDPDKKGSNLDTYETLIKTREEEQRKKPKISHYDPCRVTLKKAEVIKYIVNPYLTHNFEKLEELLKIFPLKKWLIDTLLLQLSTLKDIPATYINNKVFNEIRQNSDEEKVLEYEVNSVNSNNCAEALKQQRCFHFTWHKKHFTRLVNIEDYKGLIEARILENHLNLCQTQEAYDQYMEDWLSLPRAPKV